MILSIHALQGSPWHQDFDAMLAQSNKQQAALQVFETDIFW